MKNLEHGGPAFPLHEAISMEPGNVDEHKRLMAGMTLRDYFAAKAMQAMVAAEFNMNVQAKYWAEESYRVADAMLSERAK